MSTVAHFSLAEYEHMVASVRSRANLHGAWNCCAVRSTN